MARVPINLELRIQPLDLDQTLGCGQTFRWRRAPDGSWSGPLGRQLVRLRRTGRMTVVTAVPGTADVGEAVANYLRAEDDIVRIQRALAADRMLSAGMSRMSGLRIVKIDEWECLVSYMLATYANIPRITMMIDAISRRYGDAITGGVHAFPSFASLRDASPRDLEGLGLGYRAKHLAEACQLLDGTSMRRLARLDYANLREQLKELPGVGDKVADCVSLFGFGRLEAFPIDVWVSRALDRLYGASGGYAKLMRFAQARFGAYAGYAQEYLFLNERTRASSGFCSFTSVDSARS